MAFPVVQSSQQASDNDTGTSSITVTAPTGIETGDLLLLFVGYYETGTSRTITTPTGFATLHKKEGFEGAACYYKTAVLADESASDYTVSFSGTVDHKAVSIHRISGAAGSPVIADSEIDLEADNTGTDTVPVYTTAITPFTDESLVVFFLHGADNSISTPTTISGYATTPSATFTEIADTGTRDGLSNGNSIGVAAANYTGTTTITSRTATFSAEMSRDNNSILLVINGQQDATANVGRLDAAPELLGISGSNTATADISRIEAESTLRGLSCADSSDRTQWINESDAFTTWTNET